MKYIVSLALSFTCAFLALASVATADVPTVMQYQGYLTDAEGEALDDTLSMTFTIYDDPYAGAAWWSETQPEVVVSNGLFNVLLGSVNPIVDTVFAETQRWLGITVAPDPEIVPRTRLVTVPYAFRVATLDLAAGGLIFGTVDADGFSINGVPVGTSTDSYWSAAGSDIYYNPGYVGIGTTSPSEALDVEGNIHAGGNITSGSSITIDGTTDKITATSGTIDFDDENILTTGKATIGPGHTNTGSYAFVAGKDNDVSGHLATVGGGFANSATDTHAVISGGWGNQAWYRGATVSGGEVNLAWGDYCAIGGGSTNQTSLLAATVSGGVGNRATDTCAIIGGGWLNVVEGKYSAILGGYADTITSTADYSYLFGIDSKLTEDSTFMVDMPHIFLQGEIWLADSAGDTTSLLSGFPGGGGFIGTMGANRSNNTGLTYVGGYPNKGALGVMDANSDWRAEMIVSTAYDVGMVQTRGPNSNRNARLTYTLGYPNHGCVSITDSLEQDRGHFNVNEYSAGVLTLFGPNGNLNVSLYNFYDDPNNGWLGVFDGTGDAKAGMYANDGNSGTLFLLDPNNYYNVYIGNMAGGYNRGVVVVCDSVGISQAGMEVNASGQGLVWADTKNFRVANPNEPGTDIWYCCLEGPEAAAYVRGTGHLESGRAEVTLPDHFVAVASSQGITVQVTPLSAESKGLAVVQKSPEMFAVRELNNGNGTYDFDFMVTAVRKGHEDYQVIRPAMKMQPPELGAAPGAAPGGDPDGSDIQLQKMSR